MRRRRLVLTVLLAAVALALPQLAIVSAADPPAASVPAYQSYFLPLKAAASVGTAELARAAFPRKKLGPTTEAAEQKAMKEYGARGITYTVDSRTLDSRKSGAVSTTKVTYDYIGKERCLGNASRGGYAGTIDGWFKNHFSWKLIQNAV